MSWARGLREERLEDTGVLALVLTALSRELERPVDLGGGRTGVPRAEIELDADVCGTAELGNGTRITAAQPIGPEAPEDLPSDWLDDGECVTGDLRFQSMDQGGRRPGLPQQPR